MHIRYKTYLLPCILAAALIGGCAGNGQTGSGKNNAAQESRTAESDTAQGTGTPSDTEPVTFEAQTLDGTSLSEALFSGSRITMVNVWATYCNPCLKEMPGLGELAGAYDSEDFQLIGIISDVMEGADEKTLQKASDLVEQTGAAYPHLLLNESLYTSLLTGVSAVPTTFFINQEGQILDTVIGAMERSAWEEKIDALLEE